MNSISNISILPEINSTSIWHTLVDNVLNGIAYLFAAILSTRARKIETAPVGVLQNTSAIETVLDIYGNAILRLAYSYLHNMSDAEDILQDTLIKYMQSSPASRRAVFPRAARHTSSSLFSVFTFCVSARPTPSQT